MPFRYGKRPFCTLMLLEVPYIHYYFFYDNRQSREKSQVAVKGFSRLQHMGSDLDISRVGLLNEPVEASFELGLKVGLNLVDCGEFGKRPAAILAEVVDPR